MITLIEFRVLTFTSKSKELSLFIIPVKVSVAVRVKWYVLTIAGSVLAITIPEVESGFWVIQEGKVPLNVSLKVKFELQPAGYVP